MLNKAINLAISAHANQTDKAGQPYIRHLFRVMEKGTTETEKICGVLHDIVEDTDYTFEQLKKEGFSDEVINVIKCVTKLPNENYSEFINRIAENPIAVKVKINDLEDNMDITRLNNPTEKDYERIAKYHNAYKYLTSL